MLGCSGRGRHGARVRSGLLSICPDTRVPELCPSSKEVRQCLRPQTLLAVVVLDLSEDHLRRVANNGAQEPNQLRADRLGLSSRRVELWVLGGGRCVHAGGLSPAVAQSRSSSAHRCGLLLCGSQCDPRSLNLFFQLVYCGLHRPPAIFERKDVALYRRQRFPSRFCLRGRELAPASSARACHCAMSTSIYYCS